ncbi:MAG: UDP-N-acetylmuramate dehydrogenase, partial [Candidatus Aminicenantes bacterium]|nr:UDP-N-acetylmuramate dehydrogenase [Candidatus Aminicenantes bacterium]
TNLLFDDMGFRGLIIKNGIKGIQLNEDGLLSVLSGSKLKEVLQFCVEEKRQGLEFLAGIPGTVGGAVYGNAGAFGQCIGSFLSDVLLLSVYGQLVTRAPAEMEFSYRDSGLKRSKEILLEARFRLQEGDPDLISQMIRDHIDIREKKHPPYTVPSAGSYFKNPFPPRTQAAAAVLLEKAGAKELTRGAAAVSPIHANFIVNTGYATAADVRALAEELKERVRKRFGIELEEEVIYLPADPSMP